MRLAVFATAIAAAVVAAAIATSSAVAAGCTSAAAAPKLLLATSGVPAEVRQVVRDAGHGGGAGVTSAYCRDLVASSAPDLLVNVSLGGTIGGIAWVVLQRAGNSWIFVHAGRGKPSAGPQPRHVSAKPGVRKGEILEYQPLYAKNDPNCCPRGEIWRTYRWNGKAFVLLHVKRTAAA